MLIVGDSIYILGPTFLELEVTRWGIIVRDAQGRRIGLLRAVEG